MFDVLEHPDAPSLEEMGEYLVEPVAPEEIREKRAAGLTLVEENLLQHDDVDAYIELSSPADRTGTDIGTVVYRLIQLFGTPQLPEYRAGTDIGWRTDDTFKYLFRVSRGVDEDVLAAEDGEVAPARDDDAVDADDEWLVTVFDHRVRLGVGLAEWHEDPDATVEVDPEEVIPLMAVVKQGVTEPVECEYKDIRF